MNDLISRQMAMEDISKQHTYKMFEGEDTLYLDANDVGSVLASLPSVQPVIRCKDCKWKQGSECVRFADVRPFDDDFCSRAERREE